MYAYPQFNGWNIVPLPASPAPRQITFRACDSVSQVQSPFTMSSQIQNWPGADWWELDVALPPMTQLRAKAWVAWLTAMRGKANVFQIGDPVGRGPTPASSGTILLNGVHYPATNVVNTRGWNSINTPNMINDPEFGGPTSWNFSPPFYMAVGAGHITGNAWIIYGQASQLPPTSFGPTPPIAVTPGQTYTVSVYVDARNLVAGLVGFNVIGNNSSNGIASALATPGTNGRIWISFTVPSGTSAVNIYFGVIGPSTVSQNKPLKFSNPQMEIGSSPSAYQSIEVLVPGDYIQIGYRLHVLAGPIAGYGVPNGLGSFEVWPSLREQQPDGTSVQIVNPQGLFRLADNKREWSVNEAAHYGFSFKAVEAR